MADEVSERLIRSTLRGLAKQRVSMILPGDVWFVEEAVVVDTEAVAAALSTCLIRGWVAIQSNAVPTGTVETEGERVVLPKMDRVAPVYRLTEAGWDVIHGTHRWVMLTFCVAALGLAGTIAGILLGWGC